MTIPVSKPDILLQTSRLLLRRFRPDDVAVFSAYRSDPVIARYQAWTAPVSRDAGAAKIAEFIAADPAKPGWSQYAIELKANGLHIGDVGVNLHDDLTQATLALDPTGRGRQRWSNRWLGALNTFDIAFDGRSAGRP